MKRAILISAIVLILGLAFITGISLNVRSVHKEAAAIDKTVADMSKALGEFRSEFDHLARRVAVYQALSEGAKERLSGLEVWQITDIIISYCARHRDVGLTPSILLAVWQQESAFNPTAVSYKGAVGLGQLMWLTALPHLYDLGHVRPARTILFNPVINAEVSIREIIRLRKHYVALGITGWGWPIASYFWGTGNVWRVLWYAHQVMGRAEKYQGKGVM